MASRVVDQIDSEDNNLDKNSEVPNFNLKNYRKDVPFSKFKREL